MVKPVRESAAMYGKTPSLPENSSEAYWARRGQVGVSNVEGARRTARPSSPGGRRIDRELGTSLRSLAFMDKEDLSPRARAHIAKVEASRPPPPSMFISPGVEPAVHLKPLNTTAAGASKRDGSNDASPVGSAGLRPADQWPSTPTTPLQTNSPPSTQSSSPRPRSALTSSLMDQGIRGSPSLSPAARAYNQATSPAKGSSSGSPHTSPLLAKRQLSYLSEEPTPSFGQSVAGPSRRGSGAAPSVAIQHSKAFSSSSSSSSPSIPDGVPTFSRPGIYRPPHLRHRDSGSGLIPTIAHYDRVRTPSLRGQSRSRESSISVPHRASISSGISRPPSTAPIAEGKATAAPSLTTEAVEQHLRTLSPERIPPLNRTWTLSSLASSRYAFELESPTVGGPDRMQEQQQLSMAGWGARLGKGRATSPGGESSVAESEEFELSADEMMRSSLTDSYMLSRRNSFASGRGVEGVIDIFEVGDRLGPGMMHDGHLITIAQTSDGFKDQGADRSGSKLEVVGKLGEGSYACVYLVKEVFDNLGSRHFTGSADEASKGEESSAPFSSTPTATRTFAKAINPLQPIEPAADAGDVTLMDLESFGGSTLRKTDSPLEARLARENTGAATGRSFALKCLCKRDLTPEMLDVQRLEATIHQSIAPHPNIVTLYRTYETPEWLFLVLEYCPGQDLFYWLEQAQDGLQMTELDASLQDILANETIRNDSASESTPPDASLLATTAGVSILSRRRLRLISRMFQQMCNAVQFCHDRGISHRDIKPENFIVEDSRQVDTPGEAAPLSPMALSDSVREGHHKVNVKLTDFGLATAEERCYDFECGSKPYMSYECRNDVEPSYDPKQADVWSLGIVLLNMLFHRNPFKEPSPERCPSFAAFQQDPVRFLMEAFDGLTEKVATFLAERVFCGVQTHKRATAAEFGAWAAELVDHMGLSPDTRASTPSRGASMGITTPLSHSRSRTSLLSRSSSAVVLSSLASPSIDSPIPEGVVAEMPGEKQPPSSTAESDGEQQEVVEVESSADNYGASAPVAIPSNGTQDEGNGEAGEDCESSDEEGESAKPTVSGKRRKRGARKTRSSSRAPSAFPPSSPVASAADWSHANPAPLTDRLSSAEDLLSGLAEASQNLAREISKAAHEKRLVDAKLEQLAASGFQFERRGSADSGVAAARAPPSKPSGTSEDLRRLQDSGRTRPTSWRDRNQSTATVSSIASGSSQASFESDDASIYTTASAPATYARKSQDTSRHRRGLFGKSSTGLQPISEKSKKDLDASYLAEIFGGSAAARPAQRSRGHHSYNGREHSTDPYRGGHRSSRHADGRTSAGSGTSSASNVTSLPARPSHLPQHPGQPSTSTSSLGATSTKSSTAAAAPRIVPSASLSRATEAAAASVTASAGAGAARSPESDEQAKKTSTGKASGLSKFFRSKANAS